jgi:Ca-activated chloride channel family protein
VDEPVAGLIDIPLPPEVGLWPQTWPARIAIVALLAAVAVTVWRFARHRYVNRYRREALGELTRIERADTAELPVQLALLLRRTALAAFPREQVAPLAGSAWLAFLDRTGGGTEFSRGTGRWLASAPYARVAPSGAQQSALIALVRRWIRKHHA